MLVTLSGKTVSWKEAGGWSPRPSNRPSASHDHHYTSHAEVLRVYWPFLHIIKEPDTYNLRKIIVLPLPQVHS